MAGLMHVGYARVSTEDQHLDAQLDELRGAGCERIVTERVSGAAIARPQLRQLLDQVVRAGDVVVVWRLDRLGRSLRELLDLVAELERRGVGLRSLREAIDTTTPAGRLTFHVFGALAEFERDLIRERTRAGLAAARARGRVGGRPHKATADKVEAARRWLDAGGTVTDAARVVGLSRATLYRRLNAL